MPTIVLHLEFDEPIDNDELVELFINVLKKKFPGILMASGKNIEVYSDVIKSLRTFIVVKNYNKRDAPYSLFYSQNSVTFEELNRVLPFNPISITDGWDWFNKYAVDWDQTSHLFNQLNESIKNKNKEKGFILCFNPSITEDDWDKVAEVLTQKGIKWVNNKTPVNYNPFKFEGWCPEIGMLAYNIWPLSNGQFVLTWDSDCNDLEGHPYLGEVPTFDGWQWLEENTIDWDKTSHLFDLLNEEYWALNKSKSVNYFDQLRIGDEIIIKELNPCYYNVNVEMPLYYELEPLEPLLNQTVKVVNIEYVDLKEIDSESCHSRNSKQKAILIYHPLLVKGHDGNYNVEICRKTKNCYWIGKDYVTIQPIVDYDQTSDLFDQLN